MESESIPVLDTRELLWKARRYRYPALLPIVLVFCGAFLYLKAQKPVYESGLVVALDDRSRVGAALQPLVQSGQRETGLGEKVAGVKSRVLNVNFLESIANQTGLSRDPDLLRAAAAASRKYRGLTPEEYATRSAVTLLAKKITIAPASATNIRIAVKDESPEEARRLATAVGQALIESTRRQTLTEVQARGEFSQDQISVYAEKLRRSEDALRAYQESIIGRQIATGPVTEDNSQLVSELSDATDKEIEQIRDRIESDRQTWASTIGSAPIPALRSPRAQEIEGRLGGLEASYGVASIQKGGGNREEAQSLQQQIGGARQSLLSEYESLADKLPESYSADARALSAGIALDRGILRSLQTRKGRLQGLLGSFRNEARSSPREQMELERLRNEVQTNRDLLTALQREATSSRLSEALETSDLAFRVEVVEAPQLPLKPVWPDPIKVTLGALLLGPMLSVGVIVLAERMGAILRTVEQAEAELGTEVIGTIPRIEGWSRPGGFFHNHWAPISILSILLLTALLTGVFATIHSSRQGITPSGQVGR